MDPSKYLVDGKYSIKDLVDLNELRSLFQGFTDAMGFTIGFLSAPELEVLIATGWRDICTKYHRSCPLAMKRCRNSNNRLVRHLKRPGQIVIEACENGLVDCATPIIIQGKKIAILATGQALLKPPKIEYFRKQAKLFGVNEKKYLRALNEIPVISPKQLKKATRFLGKLAHMVIRMGYAGLAEKERGECLELEAFRRKDIEKALGESEEMFRTFTEQSPNMIFINQGGKVVYANPMCEKVMGYTLKEFCSPRFNFLRLMHPEDIAVVRRNFILHQKGREIPPYEYKMITKSGDLIQGILASKIISYRGGRAILGIITDITDRKKEEEALRLKDFVFNTSLAATSVAGMDGILTEANDAFLLVWGYRSKAEVIGKPIAYFFKDPNEAEVVIAALNKTGRWKGDFAAKKKDKSIFIAHALATSVRDERDEVIGYQSTIIDVTQQKAAEAALKENRRQMLQIIDAVPHMIFAKDKTGRFLLVNRAVGAMYGKGPQDLVGVRRRDIHPDKKEAEQFLKADRKILTTGKPYFVSDEIFTDIERRKHVLQTIKMPFKMAGIKETCILGVSVDVTEQKQIEEFRNDIVRTVSHELRTPLSIQKEGISLVLDESSGEISPKQKMILGTVMRSVDRLSRMITSLLDISRIESGKIEFHPGKVVFEDLVKDVAFEFKKRAQQKGIDLRVKLPEDTVQVLGDADKITQILANLVDNAVKFTGKGSVEISAIKLKGEVECTVRDTGSGIALENIGKIFEKFQKFSRTAGPGEKGLGLGLSIAKGIIDMHEGRIWAKSELGNGTRVTFTLPLYGSRVPKSVARGVEPRRSLGGLRQKKKGV